MKKWLAAFILWLLLAQPAWAADGDLTRQVFDGLSTDQINRFIARTNRELNEDLPLLTAETVQKLAAQGLSADWDELGRTLLRQLFHELVSNSRLMGKLLVLAILCAVMQNLQSSFAHSGVALLAYGVCFVFLAVIALTAFSHALKLAAGTVDTMVSFMQALLPLLLTLLAGVGGLTSAALLTPLMLFVVSAVSTLVKDVVLPLLLLTAALECVNYLSHTYRITYLAHLFKQAGMVMLGFIMMVFIGVVTIQGVAGGVADGMTLRTAKFAASTFIPVVGKVFSDTVELVMGASLLLKNAIGIFGVLVILMICVLPLIKIIALAAMMKMTGALVQPLGDERMAKCLDGMGNNLLLVFGALLTVALMFFLAVTMIIGAGGIALMLR